VQSSWKLYVPWAGEMAIAIEPAEQATDGLVERGDAGLPSGDAELVAAANRGDRAAFSRLYERYGPVVHGALIARVPAQDAADLTNDVFVVALRRLESLRRGESVGGWLLAIARARAVLDWKETP
jgi:hypothetical protein